MKAPIKRLLGRTIFSSRLGALLLRNTAVVVTFHRVQNTDSSEPLTISVRAFEQYCRFFARHFRVVALGDLVAQLERGETPNRELAITFDDGYLDNFENAAPVLERYHLPATFFVVSQWIGTDIVPWWDAEAGVRHPWMTWEQVRSLHRRGFDIGAHTRTHADLGAVVDFEASEEIVGGRHELERQLGAPVELFAYPYGRPVNLADSNRRLVRGAGFRCCCSCFGGLIAPGTDPFYIQRVPITPRYDSPLQFGFEVALGRSVLAA
ncbi:MAG: polysaccharide deacetylase family protein [Vicinamibacterales bacterium]